MLTLIKSLYLLSLIVWIGTIVFFSFVGAPGIFRSLSPVDAGKVVGVIFPNYYILGYVCGTILLLAAAWLRNAAASQGEWSLVTALAGLMLALTLYAGLAIQPRAAALRPQLHEEATAATVKPEFDRLHHRAVQLNAAVLLAGLVVTILTARSLKP
ncbi:MAG: DUF4149 domain-containing protein [Deltaproteobacteria bacterium]|nr:DUF4149 domain-containing protein [Deltaproteobacteria bacterium]